MSTITTAAPPIWDALQGPPHSPLRARAAEALFRRVVADLPVRVALAGGERLGAGGADAPLMRVPDPAGLFHRLGADSKIGFGESYMAGEWDSPDPAALLTPFAARMSTLVPRPLQALRRWVDPRKPAAERNTPAGARSNISRHYDLSNEVFATFLDETMTYSAALFRPGIEDLAAAQRLKIDRILDAAGVRTGTRLLEIGTGWGELALRAAARGAQVTTLTLSHEQKALTERRIRAAGLQERVAVHLRDYRDERGRYDAVVSVEMIEAVGAEYWPDYFRALDALVAPGGRVALQAITMPHRRVLATRGTYTWIHKYVFPGGEIPSVEAIEQHVAQLTRLRVRERESFGASYAETLHRWRTRFLERWDDVAALGFSTNFRRMWEFYLAYSEAGFRAGYLDVHQLVFGEPHGS
ncbi:class I SAM-dependent methyltransferase [Saccharopolyspora sp. HNM0983]|uniref:Class I SAM-dependent methyltransferase n=1 Tax=Saccharopolyspora montiporae TaxID=2781240 RepID=A0A929B600_9PSEU|nr:class I SAM-dependent methyltransferase [Saccharopolyspora sp. HNM0983]MBE9373832.1 class I SAM-dependent methyltransferase [Saccharopolyspora sp. HNM0983]